MRIEEKKKVDHAKIIDVFNDFRIEDGLNWVKSLNATSHLLGISTDEIEEVLLDNQIYEKKDKKTDKESDKESDKGDNDDEKDSKDKKENLVVVLNKETKLPNSDIILEKGDTIEIINHRV